ncbi:MAG: hypothetical protein HKO92_07955 [Flavobacteriaceae bacterium]|nr:hypothetical protein [Flavobacteriaceae bacterium]
MVNWIKENQVISFLILVSIVILIAFPPLGFLIIIMGVISWVIVIISNSNSNKKFNRKESLINQFGEEYGAAVLNKTLVIGMHKEAVRLVKGNPEYVKKNEKVGVKTEKWYWGKYEHRKATKYKKFAVIENNKLIEFGDI